MVKEYIPVKDLDDFRDAIMDRFLSLCDYNDFCELTLLQICETIDKIYDQYSTRPAADVRPVVRGEWRPTYHTYYNRDGAHQIADEWHCSQCGIYSEHTWNFCPDCGADLRKGEDDG